MGLRWQPRYPLRAAFLLTIAGEPALLLLLARGELLGLIIAFALISGVAGTLFNVLWFTAMQREIPASELSRVSSWDHFGSYLLQPIGLALVGPLAVSIGISATLYLGAGLSVLVTLAVVSVRDVRDFRLSSPPAAGAEAADGEEVPPAGAQAAAIAEAADGEEVAPAGAQAAAIAEAGPYRDPSE